MRALAIAATGMAAQQMNVEVIANNVANINTTSFKRARAEFSDLLYQTERTAGVPNAGGGNPVPEGARIGLGTRTIGVRNLHIQGPLGQTGNPLDLAINGGGWFQITNPAGETVYTRAGSFNKGPNGELVTIDGYTVEPAMTFPADTVDITVNESGEVYATVAGQADPQLLGQLTLVNFANDAGLEPLGSNLYRETTASGQPTAGVATDPGFGKINQGYLEGSNVDPVKEITELIAAQRAYEMNSKVIQAADDMSGTVSKGIR
ncbi:flagellar basal-body rod protein FlgG [Afifella marina]|uniref:Flagellar basal-body rod protein FlgG n=1 Tax=Afifella marina DSM 2698 TaxID=1120955 RepID=A0A1G5MWN2_AFIMA|nr:flagellar basal-body rod protein FlgG [Afifella marina]MBK1622037.1 flagellar basal-body rod protein FlgG [Afifella marina DSM 2698]MBK1627830.1 flagellar basal-body rod protein FlgG [Afifella marina]MBK5916797.1 flagellar basal-body rod protein FlgG [Afifella marina]RAI19878.1 flagellar basal-body rod protein FlgG [Afifella marina DSM 2698]SCZ28951.1 flagellar basal-body rod protein FlgG [Afifella marina DSM 2698]